MRTINVSKTWNTIGDKMYLNINTYISVKRNGLKRSAKKNLKVLLAINNKL